MVLVAVTLVSINLRPGATSLGPVLAEVRGGLDMSAGAAGAITGLPGLCFAFAGALAVRLGRRVGVTSGIALGLVAIMVGLLLRVLTDSVVLFFAFSVVALAGMAVGNVLVPAWIKAHGRTVAPMMLYSTGLIIGGSIGPLLSAPLSSGLGGWRPGLGAWGVVVMCAVPVWLWLARHERRAAAEHRVDTAPPDGRILHSPTALALTALFGLQAMHGYVQFGWLPQIYRDAGLSASYAGALTAMLSAVGVIGALVMPRVIAGGRGLSTCMWGFGALYALGYSGLLVAPSTVPWVWTLMLGVAGYTFPTSLALLTARTRTPDVTALLSGFVQPTGYLMAAIGPLAVGLLYESTGGWTVILWGLIASAVPLTWAALRAARPAYVDDELGGLQTRR